VSSTLGTLIQVQNSLSTPPINSPNEKIQSQQHRRKEKPTHPLTTNHMSKLNGNNK
ncbi:unnamed protein product, partial [Rotaria sordida]